MKYSIFILISLFLLSTPAVFAQVAESKDSVILPQDKVVNENYFAAGKAVTISGTVNGDVYAAGGNLLVDGTVNGDLLIAGGTMQIDGVVNGDIRAAGGQINITGEVTGNVTVGGGTVTVAKTAKIGKSIVAGAGQLSILAPVTAGVTAGAGQLTIGNTVGGNVLAGTGQLFLTPNAVVEGNINYYSEEKAQIQSGAVVSGKVNFHKQVQPQREIERKSVQAKSALLGLGLFLKIYSIIVSLIFGAILLRFAPRVMAKATDLIETQPWNLLLIGLALMIGVPILGVFLLVTVLGIPFAVLIFVLYFIYLYFAKLFVALFVGEKIGEKFNMQQSPFIYFLIGIIVLALLTSIPVLGGFIQVFVTMIGLGTIFVTKKHYWKTLRAKNIL